MLAQESAQLNQSEKPCGNAVADYVANLRNRHRSAVTCATGIKHSLALAGCLQGYHANWARRHWRSCLRISSPVAAPPWRSNCQPASRGRHSVERTVRPSVPSVASPKMLAGRCPNTPPPEWTAAESSGSCRPRSVGPLQPLVRTNHTGGLVVRVVPQRAQDAR